MLTACEKNTTKCLLITIHVSALSLLLGTGIVHAWRIPQTPDLGTKREVYEIYNGRYGTAYESSAELDVMRAHDMGMFSVSDRLRVAASPKRAGGLCGVCVDKQGGSLARPKPGGGGSTLGRVLPAPLHPRAV